MMVTKSETEFDHANVLERSKHRIRRRKFVGHLLSYVVLTVLALFFLFPFLVMFCLSILSDAEINQQILSSGSSYLRYTGNTLIVAGILTFGIPFVSSLCAYGFSKMEFKGRNFMFSIVLATMMIPSVISIVPLYTIYAKLNWLDTLYPLFVPSLFGGGAVNIFLIRQFMTGIPKDLLKSAQLDGANSFIIYSKIVVPICKPILLYVAVMSFIGAWNDFMGPFTYIMRGSQWSTLALGVYWDYGPVSTETFANIAMAAGVLMMLPCVVLFFVFQRSLIEGVALTGLKA